MSTAANKDRPWMRWALTALSAAFVGAGAISVFFVVECSDALNHNEIALVGGCVVIERTKGAAAPWTNVPLEFTIERFRSAWRWRPECRLRYWEFLTNTASVAPPRPPNYRWLVVIPLWIPLGGVLGASVWAWWRTPRRPQDACRACGYPIGTSPVCSECGKPVRPKAVQA